MRNKENKGSRSVMRGKMREGKTESIDDVKGRIA